MARRSTEAVLRYEIERAEAAYEKACDLLDAANEKLTLARGAVEAAQSTVQDMAWRVARGRKALDAFLPPEQIPLEPEGPVLVPALYAEAVAGWAAGQPAELEAAGAPLSDAQVAMSLMGATPEQIAALDAPSAPVAAERPEPGPEGDEDTRLVRDGALEDPTPLEQAKGRRR